MTTPPPLLALAQGRKVRPRKVRIVAPFEVELHKDVAKLLKNHCLPDWKYFHVPNGEFRPIRTAARLKAMGTIPGIPDFIFISPYGSVRCLELKRVGEDIEEGSPQDDFRLWCIQHGVPHVVARTIDEVGAACDAWGCLRVKFVHAHAQPEALAADGDRP